jgi:hypothetical protein
METSHARDSNFFEITLVPNGLAVYRSPEKRARIGGVPRTFLLTGTTSAKRVGPTPRTSLRQVATPGQCRQVWEGLPACSPCGNIEPPAIICFARPPPCRRFLVRVGAWRSEGIARTAKMAQAAERLPHELPQRPRVFVSFCREDVDAARI